MDATHTIASAPSYQLQFRSLRQRGNSYSFPCSEDGRVDLDGLTEDALNDYLFARTVVGGEFARPSVQCMD